MKALALRLSLVVFLIGGLLLFPKFWIASPPRKAQSIGSVETFAAGYERWIRLTKQSGGDRILSLSLTPVRGFSGPTWGAHGKMTLDIFDGTLLVETVGLPATGAYDVWLIHNRPGLGHSVKPDSGDAMIRLGSLNMTGDKGRFETRLEQSDLVGFKLDAVAVTAAGRLPQESFLLFGSPGLFQRLYYSGNYAQLVKLGRDRVAPETIGSRLGRAFAAPFRALIPAPAHADSDGTADIPALIKKGEDLFFNVKFNGNGRTCGTCHPAENNFTLDPPFIATLPRNDPLFVAEFMDALNSEKNGGLIFEIPSLMRSKGLIVENVDGFDDLKNKFVMRGIPHTLSMGVSLNPAVIFGTSLDGSDPNVIERTGWGGDGAPANGSLRNFMIGAITQHYPLTLDRVPGVDFILPTDEELDALEAFQLSLGRSTEFGPLPLDFKPHLADAIAGQRIFLNPGTDPSVGAGKCNICHENAGANLTIPGLGTFNFNFNTGVEDALRNQIGPDPLRPPDGGFGTQPNGNGSFGNGTFNTPVLVEAADTGPFFHNNLVDIIEDAVAFYNRQEFQDSPSGQFLRLLPDGSLAPTAIDLLDFEVNQVAAFLRVINAIENIRSVTDASHKAKGSNTLVEARKHLRVALADCQDAIDVLSRRDASLPALDLVAVNHLQAAKELLQRADFLFAKPARDALIQSALMRSDAARSRLTN